MFVLLVRIYPKFAALLVPSSAGPGAILLPFLTVEGMAAPATVQWYCRTTAPEGDRVLPASGGPIRRNALLSWSCSTCFDVDVVTASKEAMSARKKVQIRHHEVQATGGDRRLELQATRLSSPRRPPTFQVDVFAV